MDRELLVAFMALQSDFITRQQFLSAFATWLVDRSRGIDKILVDHAFVTPSQLSRVASKLLELQSRPQWDWQSVVAKHGAIGTVYSDMLTLAKKDAAVMQLLNKIGESMSSFQIPDMSSRAASRFGFDHADDPHATFVSDSPLDPYDTLTAEELEDLK